MNNPLFFFKKVTVFIFSIFYMAVGVAHFWSPDTFLIIMPPYLPFHLELVYISGFFEILLGLLLMSKKYRYFAGVGLILLLIAVFPANIYLYNSDLARELYGGVSQYQVFIRMLFQPFLIIIAYWHSRDNHQITFSYICFVLSIVTIIYFSNILF